MNNRISVIIPSFNGEAFIDKAIQSINKQTLAVHEIIVVDDGSTDRTEEIVKQQTGNIHFIKQEHTGNPASGRNRGIKESTGTFIAFLDQDDLWPENKLELQYQKMCLPEQPDVVIGLTKIVYLGKDHTDLELDKRIKNDFSFLLSAALFKRQIFDSVGYFDENLKYYGSDTEWLFRAREKHTLFYIQKDVSLFWQRHDNNHMNNFPTWRESIIEVMKLSIKKRFKAGKDNYVPLPKLNLIYENNTNKFLS